MVQWEEVCENLLGGVRCRRRAAPHANPLGRTRAPIPTLLETAKSRGSASLLCTATVAFLSHPPACSLARSPPGCPCCELSAATCRPICGTSQPETGQDEHGAHFTYNSAEPAPALRRWKRPRFVVPSRSASSSLPFVGRYEPVGGRRSIRKCLGTRATQTVRGSARRAPVSSEWHPRGHGTTREVCERLPGGIGADTARTVSGACRVHVSPRTRICSGKSCSKVPERAWQTPGKRVRRRESPANL